MNGLIRLFVIGIILGVAGSGALVYLFPAVDLHREQSLVSVQANGGNRETFHINLPGDRVLVGLAGAEISVPAGLKWPSDERLGNFQAEIFKVRDKNDVVVGVGTRMASSTDPSGSFIEWSVHLPARGTIYAKLDMEPAVDGYRNGVMRSGTRDFELLSGSIQEQFIAEIDDNLYDVESRIVLVTSLIGVHQMDDNQELVDVVAGTSGGSL